MKNISIVSVFPYPDEKFTAFASGDPLGADCLSANLYISVQLWLIVVWLECRFL